MGSTWRLEFGDFISLVGPIPYYSPTLELPLEYLFECLRCFGGIADREVCMGSSLASK